MEKVVSEKMVERYFVQQIRAIGGWCWKMSIPGVRGIPDRLCLFKGGILIFVELKRPKGGILSQWQIRINKKLTDYGFMVLVVYSKQDVDDLIAIITNRSQ